MYNIIEDRKETALLTKDQNQQKINIICILESFIMNILHNFFTTK